MEDPMKKLALLLALLTVLSVFAVACNNGSDTPEETTTTTTKKTTTTRRQDDPGTQNPPEETKTPDLLSSEGFALDGDLSEYANLAKVELIGQASEFCENSENKKATFYGAMTDKGLYLAVDVYHDKYVGDSVTWYQNCNFEFFVGPGRENQYYAFARGIGQECSTSAAEITAYMVTEKIDQGTVYHTIVEAFLPMEEIDESNIYYNTVDVGVAWKTEGEDIVGGMGTAREGGADDWWVPKGSWPNDGRKTVVAPSGIFLQSDYEY